MNKVDTFLFSLLAALALSGCPGPLVQKPDPASNTGAGKVRVSLTQGEARTLAPQAELSVFNHLEYLFAKDDAAAAAKTPQDGIFVLEAGAYTLTVNAYMSEGTDKLAASGTASFAVTAGNDSTVNLTLQPVVSGSGTGTFKYALAYPNGVAVESLSITRIGGSDAIDLQDGAEATATGLNGEKTIGVGYYLFTVSLSLTKADGPHFQRRIEVVHIYQNMTTEAAAADYTFTEEHFAGEIFVTSAADSGEGTLRDALSTAAQGTIIHIDLPAGSIIELESRLSIGKNLTIEGNGLTLTRAASWTTVSGSSNLLYIDSGFGTVIIRRIHFKDGWVNGSGGAVYNNNGNLTLESCIFSGNQTTGSSAYGGAVYTTWNLTVRGCTFYNNSSAGFGGAIYRGGGTITLSGNLFYGNTAGSDSNGHVVFGSVTSTGYNVADRPKGTGYSSGQSGFNHATDGYSTALPLAPLNFKIFGGNAAQGIITTLPADYPTVDFYGQPISAGASAGAVQEVIAASGYAVMTSTNNSAGSISITGTPNVDGLYSGSVSLTATGIGGGTFIRWLVDGADSGTNNPLSLTLIGHVSVQAVFSRTITVTSNADDGEGTLREALTNAGEGDTITIGTANQTIELESRLSINKNLTIEGNGLTLTRAASWTTVDTTSQLLYIGSNATVRIRRIHFKNGRASNYGGAVHNAAYLTLESCIFSGNQTTGSGAYGGAVYTIGSLTVRGCTFYNNSSAYMGGAIHQNGGTLSGNLFYGNTAKSASYGDVVYGSVTSTGYNVADRPKGPNFASGQSGFNHANDVYSNALPLAFLNFKVLSGSAVQGIITTLPANYPAVDFYGQPINATASAGAVQAVAASGYAVMTSTNNSNGSISITGTPNEDGLYTGSVSLTATGTGGGTFIRWLVDGADSGTNNPLNLTLTGHVSVQSVFSRTVTVTSNASTGEGTLREALTNAREGDTITIGTANQTIELESGLPNISNDITIEGNGLILTRAASWTAVNASSQLLHIASGTVRIRRIHFKDGRAGDYGAAVKNYGNLTLESCIFSGNRTTGPFSMGGGAVYTTGNLTVRGCTFYNNGTAYRGGAIYRGSGTTTLSGNLFYGNTAGSDSNGHVVYGAVTSTGFNVADRPKGTLIGQSGFNHATDGYSTTLPLAPLSFKVLSGSAAQGIITALPADYPTVDFYGQPISAGASAGAVQEVIAASGYAVMTSTNNSAGSIGIAETPNTDGLYSGTVTLTATGTGGYTFTRWLVDGADSGTNNPLSLTLTGHVSVHAVFSRTVTVTSNADEGAGTLREALTNAMNGDIITMGTANQTIELSYPLPQVSKDITIEGSSLTLTLAASWTRVDTTSQLLYILSGTVIIHRVYFKDGQASNYGGAIRNEGNLTLESCIFSGNQTTHGSAAGGAVYTIGNLTVRGCTFYNNSSGGQGGAIYYGNGTTTLSGNLFYGNTAASDSDGHVVRGFPTSTGYNVSDRPKGTDPYSGQSGFNHATDSSFAVIGINDNPLDSAFAPVNGLASFIPSAPADFPTVDFYGAARTWPGAPGAVKND